MTRDYAKRNTYRKNPKKKSSYLGLWLFVLFLFAAFTTGLVYLGKYKQQLRLKIPAIPKIINKPASTPPSEVTTKEATAPTFDFYTILPQKTNNKAIAEYELEIATVKDYAAADRLKAELALLGFTVSITKAHNQKYQITVGPYDNKDAATTDLERLKQNKISGGLKKIR
ncbi:SPOR domain-containing protein [Gammaproteobacteria bacterium]